MRPPCRCRVCSRALRFVRWMMTVSPSCTRISGPGTCAGSSALALNGMATPRALELSFLAYRAMVSELLWLTTMSNSTVLGT